MKKTYITTLPDKAGAFLQASEIIASQQCNIVRVSYNKAVDVHTLFIDVVGDNDAISQVSNKLKEVGCISDKASEQQVLLVVFKLPDIPGTVKPILEILQSYNINITYINSQENGTAFQHFKMGLLIDNPQIVKFMLDDVSKICEVTVLEYDVTEKILDNTIFYLNFADDLRKKLSLSQESTSDLIANSNEIMQMLDTRNESPYKTFEYIKKFADFVAKNKNENFKLTHSEKSLSNGIVLHQLVPPCGSNVFVLESEHRILFIDSGFACFKQEMLKLLREILPQFDNLPKEILITHIDIDHTGLLPIFDKIYLNKLSYQHYVKENNGLDNFREQDKKSAPYFRLSKIISSYKVPSLDNMIIIDNADTSDSFDEIIDTNSVSSPLTNIGVFLFEGLTFDVLQGNGGHITGEMVFVCREEPLIFSGDNLVNIKGFSAAQSEFNILAPYLMTSVNVNSNKAVAIRNFIIELAEAKNTLVCPGHGDWFVAN